MSTRSRIAVVVKDSDINKTFTADESLLHAKLDLSENPGEPEFHETTISKKIISIYAHWDGYPEGIGSVLLKEYDDYNTALNLILFGDASAIGSETVCFYNTWRGEESEKWDFVMPSQCRSIEALISDFKNSDQEYLYIYCPDSKGIYRWIFISKYDDAGHYDALAETDLRAYLNGDEPEHENEPEQTSVFILMRSVNGSTTAVGVSSDVEKLSKMLKEKVKEFLETVYGKREDLQDDEWGYELELYESLDNCDGLYWSDLDDECPTEFYITTADIVK